MNREICNEHKFMVDGMANPRYNIYMVAVCPVSAEWFTGEKRDERGEG
ncbi:MAG: hypothetical protein RR431_03145 [Clostridia bacterium]